jgi:two-component system, OmpR family, response regulator ChvI
VTCKTILVLAEEEREGSEEEERQKKKEEDDNEISFSSKSQSYCVCFVSMIDSIETTFEIKDSDKIRRYYSVFINTIAAIARNFSAKVIKNTGTSLIFYFPKTSDSSNIAAFRDVIDCGITMMAANNVINAKLNEEELPPLHYKISADYGTVEIARSLTSPDTDDLFGSTMNVCAKINSLAPPNGMVIGSDLYYIAKKSAFSKNDKCSFKKIGQYSIAASFRHQYPVYSVEVGGGGGDVSYIGLDKQIPKLQNPSPLSARRIQDSNNYSAISSIVTPKIDSRKLKQPVNYEGRHPQNQLLEREGEGEGEQSQQQQQQQKKHSHVIMLVDDEPDILLTYKTFLLAATEGYNVDAFTESHKALQQFAQVNPSYYDLVVMDIRMPGLNGLQLYYRLKAMNPTIKVLFVSALDAAQEMISILPGVKLDDVVKKPVNQEQFLYKVKTALAQ